MTSMWKKTMVILFFLSLPLSQLFSQQKSFLWKVEFQGKTSYLLGSIHALKKEHYPLNPSIENAFAQTDVLAVEMDISDDKTVALAMQLMQQGMYTGDDTIEKHLSPATLGIMQKKLLESGMSITTYSKMKPWMAATLFMQMELAKIGFNPNLGIDKHFIDKAVKANKQIAELEGAAFQMNLMTSFNEKENENFLLSTILEVNQYQIEMDNITATWMRGDVKSLEKILTGYIKKSPELASFYKKLIDDRNIGMVNKIESYLKSGKTYFVIAGAIHMIGSKGIIQLLKNKGYTVKQI